VTKKFAVDRIKSGDQEANVGLGSFRPASLNPTVGTWAVPSWAARSRAGSPVCRPSTLLASTGRNPVRESVGLKPRSRSSSGFGQTKAEASHEPALQYCRGFRPLSPGGRRRASIDRPSRGRPARRFAHLPLAPRPRHRSAHLQLDYAERIARSAASLATLSCSLKDLKHEQPPEAARRNRLQRFDGRPEQDPQPNTRSRHPLARERPNFGFASCAGPARRQK
jgi:hypothetical protein